MWFPGLGQDLGAASIAKRGLSADPEAQLTGSHAILVENQDGCGMVLREVGLAVTGPEGEDDVPLGNLESGSDLVVALGEGEALVDPLVRADHRLTASSSLAFAPPLGQPDRPLRRGPRQRQLMPQGS